MRSAAAGLAATIALLAGTAGAEALSGDLDNLSPQIWVDPNGCQHWLLDDGVEGYLTARRNRDGTPVCPGVTPATWPNAAASAPRFQQEAVVWTDRNGCQYWIADHGGAGFLTQRLSRDGRPVCPGR